MEGCIFCKIIKGEIPADKVYEDENNFVFFDIYPVSTGHLLIIPKEHVVWMEEASDEIIENTFKLAKKLMKAQKKILGSDYVHVSVQGEEVPHFHVHLMPRTLDDGLGKFPKIEYKQEELKKLAKNLALEL